MKKIVTLALLLLALSLAACGGSSSPETSDTPTTPQLVGDATRGEQIYQQATIGPSSALGCVSCHSLEEGLVLVGPSHYKMAVTAETRVSGLSAEAYLTQSITETDAYLVEGFTAGLMPNYDGVLTDQDVSDLVAYLLTLR
ncbi:MAG: cytochrome c [Chloroflexi bacterium]|nr:cytochrome c [Chloroflexota bacterium]